MKLHLNPPSLLLVTAITVLGLTSCDVPIGYGNTGYNNRGYSAYGNGIYTSLPFGYSGNAYYHNNRYYSGGRYQTGSYTYQGRRYNNRYQHGNGQYLYGGQNQYHGRGTATGPATHSSFRSSRNQGFFPGIFH